MNINQLIVSVFILLFIISCKGDSAEIMKENIMADWNVVYAERNGTPTSTLENAIFYISENEITHNLNGDTINSSYKYENNVLTIQDELIQSMEIVSLMQDTIKTKTKINKYNFDFTMVKDEKK